MDLELLFVGIWSNTWEAVIFAYDNVDFVWIPELHNQKYDRKRGYSTSSTPKNSTKNTENKVSPSDGPRKKRAAAISAGEEKNAASSVKYIWHKLCLF